MQDALKTEVFETISAAYRRGYDDTAIWDLQFVADFIVDRLRKGGISDAVIRGTLCDVEK